ncbi:hypothetical protein J8273_7339 [Carpediemonas membranifera]|uniref:Uncharacterized protein n=1 Tax=Carpediemonas membranifera TaxID=201153 RepID=A0A8J6ATG6_9EUKA|nr:hypothetical protein J8273_7339 [Carpediemonas membranifera]|eukprot:KAG9391065.1 hypothetical protein J8273_7339 [Carpediemonas membranifera]
MDTVREYFLLHSWPDTKERGGFLSKMKPETIQRLDRVWDRPGEKKVSDHVKECLRCGRYFSPGTSHQQLLTHARKCQLREGEQSAGAHKRARIDRFGEALPSTTMPAATIPLIGRIDPGATDQLQRRLNDLSAKELELHAIVSKETPMTTPFNRALTYLRVIQGGINEVDQHRRALANRPLDKDRSMVAGGEQFVVPPMVIGSVMTSGHAATHLPR